QVKQVADRLAAAGFYVAMPDFFDGHPWDMNKALPHPEFMDFIKTSGDWETKIKPLMEATEKHMADAGAKKFGTIGFCWGCSMALRACNAALWPIPPTAGLSIAAGGAHPAFLTDELAAQVEGPVVLLPSGEDGPLDSFKAVMDKKPFGARCVYKVFPDMHHGFCAARGDWSNPQQAAAAAEAVQMFADFFTKELM
ncbi:unnamed protein product, partial [Phaeothamnion confervicola]